VFGPGFNATELVGTLTAGIEYTFLVSARDAYDNEVYECLDMHRSSSHYWGAAIIGPENMTLGNSQCFNGNYTFNYTLTRAGGYWIYVFGDMAQASDSPGVVMVFAAGFYAKTSFLDDPTGTVIGNMSQIMIHAYDQFDNEIMVCDPTIYPNFTIQANSREDTFQGEVTDCVDGLYLAYIQVNVSSEQTSRYKVDVDFYDGIFNLPLLNSPLFGIEWFYGNVEATYSYAHGPGVTSQNIIAGAGTTFFVESFNPFGLFIPVCPSTNWSVEIAPVISNITANTKFGQTNCTNGTATIFYNATTARSYEVSVFLNETEIAMSPYRVTVVPTIIDPSKTLVLNRTGTDRGSFYLQIRDVYDNDETNLTKNAFGVSLSPPCANQTVNFKPVGGYLECNYTAWGGGLYCIELEYKGIEVPIRNSSFTVVGGVGCPDSCSYQGYCIYNSSTENYSCSCQSGWIDDSCATSRSSKYPLAVGAVVGLIVGLSILLFIIGLVLGYFVVGRLRKNRPFDDSDTKSLLSDE